MSFWNTSKNTPVVAKTEVDQNNDIAPIPNGTLLKSVITEAKWDEYEGTRYISIRWGVIDGEYKNRVIFHKVKVQDEKESVRDKAIEMFAAIDANAGGHLMASGNEPSDFEMMKNLCNKPMVIRVAVWEMNDKKGNWVNGVFSSGAATPKPAATNKPTQPQFDDDVPGF